MISEWLLPPIGWWRQRPLSSYCHQLVTVRPQVTYWHRPTLWLILRLWLLEWSHSHWPRTGAHYRNTILHKILVPLPEFEQLFACKSGGARSWKVQEGRKGTPIQLVWEPSPAQQLGTMTRWALIRLPTVLPDLQQFSRNRRCRKLPPSRVHRNASALKERKKIAAQDSCHQGTSPLARNALVWWMMLANWITRKNNWTGIKLWYDM